MGQARRRKLAGTYPAQTEQPDVYGTEYQINRMTSEQRRFWTSKPGHARLIEPSLLDAALLICTYTDQYESHHELAVPIGETRRGGNVCPASQSAANTVFELLKGQPGFPNLRAECLPCPDPSYCDGECRRVWLSWGEEPPTGDPVERGRFYGYTEESIQTWVAGHANRQCGCYECTGIATAAGVGA
jgi:hypothetical protein